MGKGKPRHNPEKKQNKMGTFCGYCEEIPLENGSIHYHCELATGSILNAKECKGNPHKCKKQQLKLAASRSDKRKNYEMSLGIKP